MLIYGDIRNLAYFTYKFDIILAAIFFFFKGVVSVLFQYSERIHYHDYVETRVSNLKLIKFIKDYDIGPEMTYLIKYAY